MTDCCPGCAMDKEGDKVRKLRENLFDDDYRQRRAESQRVRTAIMNEEVQRLRRADPSTGYRKRVSPSET